MSDSLLHPVRIDPDPVAIDLDLTDIVVCDATLAHRSHWQRIGRGIHRLDLDEDISISALMSRPKPLFGTAHPRSTPC